MTILLLQLVPDRVDDITLREAIIQNTRSLEADTLMPKSHDV